MLGSAFFSVISDMKYFSQILLVYTDPIQEVKNLNRTTVCFLKRKLAYLTVIITVRGQTLSRSYGRCIAEFLNEESLVRLGLLDLSTCVGLRYGRRYSRVSSFSGQCVHQNPFRKERFIPLHNIRLNGYNHEPALTQSPRTTNKISSVREY